MTVSVSAPSVASELMPEKVPAVDWANTSTALFVIPPRRLVVSSIFAATDPATKLRRGLAGRFHCALLCDFRSTKLDL